MAFVDGDLGGPRAHQPAERSPSALNSVHISQAIQNSSDGGTTLTFSRLNISDVGVWAAEELATIGRETSEDESPVKRITLDRNRLTTLPMEFALLSRLRYLNLKHNCFSVFPDVLTLMPSLDTLDIGCNKIKRFPPEAGHLINLRVFCLSRNKITRLPSYLTQFNNLEVLQVERNPIEWPPKYITEPAVVLDSRHAMQEWIRTLQQWMQDEPRDKPDDSGYSEHHDSINRIEDGYSSWLFPMQQNKFNDDVMAHTRSLSVDSNFSASSIAESFRNIRTPVLPNSPSRPPPLHLGILGSSSAEPSPTRPFESYLPSPTDFQNGVKAGIDDTSHQPQYHARTTSYGVLQDVVHVDLPTKKSMPDLRTAKLNFTKSKPANLPEADPLITTSLDHQIDDYFMVPSPLSHRQDSNPFPESGGRLSGPTTKYIDRPSTNRPTRSVTFERDAYFRRLSELPTPKTLPKSLVCLVDSARNILFAMGEIYQCLEHYVIYIIDNRTSTLLRKALDSAVVNIMQLINSLDRFDAISQRMFPSPPMCRGVVESCRDAVAVFGKALGVLALQLKTVITGDDARYSRWILLELYAATAEVSFAWQAMIPQIEFIKPLLRSKGFPSPSPLVLNSVGSETYSLSPTTAVHGSSDLLVSLRPTALGTSTSMNVGKVRTARRHAGSFSSKDVEIGKNLPSYDDVPGMFRGIAPGMATQTPILRAPKRQMTLPFTTMQSPSPTTTTAPFTPTSKSHSFRNENMYNVHSRHGSQTSLISSSKTAISDFPSNSQTQVDKEALQAIYAAVEIAPAVCDMIEEMLSDGLNVRTPVREAIDKARAVTTKLSDTVRAVQNADTLSDAKILQENAHAFLKNVVHLSNIVKTYASSHNASSSLRTNMVKLTSSTEEFAILLHVSSISLSAPHLSTPMLSVSVAQANSIGRDEMQLGSSLSRSRSAQLSRSFEPPPQLDGPHTALPSQSFQIPGPRRLRSRDQNIDIADPG